LLLIKEMLQRYLLGYHFNCDISRYVVVLFNLT
jgi:hypothetical protein